MTLLDQLLLFSGLTLLLTIVLGRFPLGGWIATIFYGAQGLLLLKMASLGYAGGEMVSALHFDVLGQHLSWRFDAVSWYFALISIGAGLFSSCYASGEWGQRFRAQGGNLWLLHVALALNVFTMLLLLASGDLLSLFIGWELVSWAGFLLMALAGGEALKAALRYVNYAVAGAMAVMAGLALIYRSAGSLEYGAIAAALPALSLGQVVVLILLFTAGFAVKMGLLPLHLWQARAYGLTPGPGSAFLGAITSRMGLYAMIVVLVQLVGLARLGAIEVPFTFLDARELLAWIAALTIVLPTYTALRQNDARMLLAWHGIGQGGYMLLGIVLGNPLGSAGGLLHVFNYGVCQLALLMAVFAVMHRTGTADLNKLGGMVARMPLSFLTLLVGIIGLAGLPPMNGFVSKWMIYRSLIQEGMPLLFVATVIGTLGTILSVYKLIHNMFLGQLRLEYAEVREVPWSMLLPMLLASTVIFVTGFMPGLVLDWVASVQATAGLPVVTHILGGVELPEGGGLDMLWVVGVLFGGFGIGALLFYSGGKSKRVHQLDNYAGGHFLTAQVRYQYSDNFYAGLMHLIGPWYRGSFQWLENAVHSTVDLLGQAMQGLYRQRRPTFMILATAVLALTWIVL